MIGLLRRSWSPVAAGSLILVATLFSACGTSGEMAPAAAPTTAPASTPTATIAPDRTVAPEPTPVPTPVFSPGPREVEFADGQFKVNFLYRSEPDLVARIEVVDVESILGPELLRIASAYEGERFTINFKGPDTAGLNEAQIATLEREGYAMLPLDIVTPRIEFRINPNGVVSMEDFWRVIVPNQVALNSVTNFRFAQASGTWIDSVVDVLITDGLGEAFRRELFFDHEVQLRELNPEFAAVIYDLTPDAEQELWAAALPTGSSNTGGQVSFHAYFRFYGSDAEFPAGAATAIGIRIVEAYQQNNPGVTAASLIHIAPDEILEGSNYNP